MMISGKESKIEVVEDRFVVTSSPSGDDVTLEPVTSGISLSLVPFALPEEQVRMDLAISVSEFIPSRGHAELTRTRSEATTTVRIGSGETLVIGGLMSKKYSKGKSGIPGVSDVPGLAFLFGQRQETENKQRLLIYITPYLWEPGMDTPIDPRDNIGAFIDRPE